MHEITETFLKDLKKEKKVAQRIIAHQQIMLENMGEQFIQSISARKPVYGEDGYESPLLEDEPMYSNH